MREIAIWPDEERAALFQYTADKTDMSASIIEKDFWVCWVLDYLFHESEWKNDLLFKGGTSLSKSYNLINRFSEDIDLVLDWEVLGYESDEPLEERGKKKQESFNWDLKLRIETFLKDELIPKMNEDIFKELNSPIEFEIDSNNKSAVNFTYPQDFTDSALRKPIRIEIATPAITSFSETRFVSPYASQSFPDLFSKPNTEILTVLPECTFWEKITILHREANRPKDSAFPDKYSRHYYDICRLFSSDVKQKAFENKEILEQVSSFKEKFYPQKWADYGNAKIGTVKLLPPEYNSDILEQDYENMQIMIFGERPSFQEMMDSIKQLESELNQLG
ncbi:hypothetical protein MmiHf6_16020 [Methanimicrococcus hongohii]|uniref:Nucleotidyl transferase AbiEii/AbiGii toxin family protein n=1 Tax=Methanimicrococcus hongohii TaxID=3028295 RepID=A0AA96VCD8_9EURY|nr:nucleotidyl transferase AbiEii/AbiGii toxin family protein [Methanimicrococcus sp. Hf6]WNY24272.1 hypothetical protein MmiHf6_16020 [Methanimicrococcus sp. Hf6]